MSSGNKVLDLPFTSPITNAAGTLGFNPTPRGLGLSWLGGFITNPISLAPRTPASGPRSALVPSGLLLHTGYPNRGMQKIIRKYAPTWARSDIPVVVHLLASDPNELYRMVRRFEEVEGVSGIEVGIPPGATGSHMRALVEAAVGELPVIVRVPVDEVRYSFAEAADAGASALSFGPSRAASPLPDGSVLSGRYYGPAIFPFAFEVLQDVVGSGLPVIFAGGLQRSAQIEQVLMSGAAGAQVDLPFWNAEPFSAPGEWSLVRD